MACIKLGELIELFRCTSIEELLSKLAFGEVNVDLFDSEYVK